VRERLQKIKLIALDVDGTFTDGTLFYDGDGKVIKGFSSHDGLGLELLRRAGIHRGFITGRHDYATEARAGYLGVDFYIVNVGDKSVALTETAEKFGVTLDECLYMGDDLNDLTVFAAAGVSVAVANASEHVKSRVDIVTAASGGKGAVREIIEAVLSAKGIDPVDLWLSEKDRRVGKQ